MTRKEIAVQILCSLTSTQDSMRAIGASADDAGIDPFVFAARSAVQFADALLAELVEDTQEVATGIDKILMKEVASLPTPVKAKRPRRKKIVKNDD